MLVQHAMYNAAPDAEKRAVRAARGYIKPTGPIGIMASIHKKELAMSFVGPKPVALRLSHLLRRVRSKAASIA